MSVGERLIKRDVDGCDPALEDVVVFLPSFQFTISEQCESVFELAADLLFRKQQQHNVCVLCNLQSTVSRLDSAV